MNRHGCAEAMIATKFLMRNFNGPSAVLSITLSLNCSSPRRVAYREVFAGRSSLQGALRFTPFRSSLHQRLLFSATRQDDEAG